MAVPSRGLWLVTACLVLAPAVTADDPKPVSFVKDVRPILQTHCLGCHQPAKAQGGYAMTSFERMQAGGDSGKPAVTAKDTTQSELLTRVRGEGKGVMPPGELRKLTAAEIATIERWVAQGAVNDSPADARPRYDAEHLPEYTRPPVIPSIDVSPDGRLIAVAGFHEVLLHYADGSGIAARLVGLSERIESIRFSPDGARLAVAGGLPARMGEIQVWDVAKEKLLLSKPVTADTLYGVSWSPDGKRIAFGCGDNTLRAIDASSGDQLLYQGAHSDWPLGTAYSADGSHVVSVGRDRSCKLTEFATQRFVDNVTSITPGALKGGMLSVARHPQRDEVVIGGSDGQPRVYRLFRQTPRVIGDDANLIRELPAMEGRVWSVAVSRDGKRIAAGSGLDGKGELTVCGYEFDTRLPDAIKAINSKVVTSRSAAEKKALDEYHREGVKEIARARVPAAVYALAFLPDGHQVVSAGGDGMLRVYAVESGRLVREWPATAVQSAATAMANAHPDFVRDVAPVLSRLGCNAGTCHGSKDGKNGFKLSLRGYDPLYDVRALTDDHASRRVSVASPDNSLMLLKASGIVPHAGGQLIKPDEKYYQLIRDWVAGGAQLSLDTPRVASIEITPALPTLARIGDTQRFRVVAKYADGLTRDVTPLAFIESGNTEVVKAEKDGLTVALRRGEAPILARYEGAYAATTLTVMGDRTGFVWSDPPTFNSIDTFTSAKWKRLQIQPSELCTDAEFLRRVYLDLTGLPPSAEAVRAFLDDKRDTRTKRDETIDRLVGSPEYVEHWTNKWADLLQVNRKFLGAEGAAKMRLWIRQQVADNVPYDRFAAAVLTATGSNRENPAAGYFKVLRKPEETMENTTHLFLGVRFNCNKCHDHPFERWTQDQYYQTAAFFAHFNLSKDPASGDKMIGGTDVESAKPLYESVTDAGKGEVLHERTNKPTSPVFPYETKFNEKPDATRRERLAAWMTSPDNRYFARSYVNRLWGYLFGVGIIEPIDDIRAGNPPTNPELLNYLTEEFVKGGFNVRHMHRLITKSRTYQLSLVSNKWNDDDRTNYSHALARRLPAEVIYDAVYKAAGATSRIPGLPPGVRAAELPDSGVELPGGFLNSLGRPPRESACECERVQSLQLGPVMALVSGQVVNDAIADPQNAISKLVAGEADDTKLINELFLRVLNRPATADEVKKSLAALQLIDADHVALKDKLDAQEKEWGPIYADLQEKRDAAIEQARLALVAYETELAPIRAEQEKKRVANIAAAEKALADYDAKLPARLAEWETQQPRQSDWLIERPTTMKSSFKSVLTLQSDGSIFASGPNGSGNYTLTYEANARLTGLRIEALTDDRLPARGPGRSAGGNFVLTELEVSVAPKADPKQVRKVALKNPLADYSQESYAVASAIDGVGAVNNNGWAVYPRPGEAHWATFEFAEPIDARESVITVKLVQNYQDKTHSLGRFRVSLTESRTPLGLGLPDAVARALATHPDEERTSEQSEVLLNHLRKQDAGRQRLVAVVNESKKPLPPDAKHVQLKQALSEAERPVPIDPKLLQLRADMKLSEAQQKNKRLTAAQDLAWALFNSPAFLFNR